MKKVAVAALLIGIIGLSALVGGAWWLQTGLQSPIKTAKATKKVTTVETERNSNIKEPLWIMRHYVSKTEWEYAKKWGLTIPHWIERLGYAQAEEIKQRNGEITQGDEIEIPVYNKTFTGIASYYGYETKGTTATGKKWDPEETLVASVFLPKSSTIKRQTIVNVTNVRTGKTIKGVEVEDSGPYAYDRENGIKQPRALDLSLGLKKKLGCSGLCKIRYTIRSIPTKYNTLSALS